MKSCLVRRPPDLNADGTTGAAILFWSCSLEPVYIVLISRWRLGIEFQPEDLCDSILSRAQPNMRSEHLKILSYTEIAHSLTEDETIFVLFSQLKALWVHPAWGEHRAPLPQLQPPPQRWAQSPRKQKKNLLLTVAVWRQRANCHWRTIANTQKTWRTR